MTDGSIYLVTRKETGETYVGQYSFSNPKKRWEQHIANSRKGKKRCLFHNALRDYGEQAFTWERLLVCPRGRLDEMEGYYADVFGSYYTDRNEQAFVPGGYNMIWCGMFSRRGTKSSPEVCAKSRERWLSDQNPNIRFPERMPRGDKHHFNTNPSIVPRGDKHHFRTNPECVPRGDKSGPRKHPERMARGERHGSRTHPEKVRRGEQIDSSKLNADKVRLIRILYASSMGFSYNALGAMFDVSKKLILNVAKRKAWAHIQ